MTYSLETGHESPVGRSAIANGQSDRDAFTVSSSVGSTHQTIVDHLDGTYDESNACNHENLSAYDAIGSPWPVSDNGDGTFTLAYTIFLTSR